MTLYDRLAEEHKEVLINDEQYPLTTGELIKFLKSTDFVNDLTLRTVVDLNYRFDCGLTIGDMYKLFNK